MAKAAQAVAPYADLSRVIACDETYKQRYVRVKSMVGYKAADRVSTSAEVETAPIDGRDWTAELVMVATPAEEPLGLPWIEFRDVTALNGKPLRDGKSRLGGLATQPLAVAGPPAVEITQAAGDYRLGRFARGVLVPRVALLFLHAINQPRFEFKKARERTISGVKTWEVTFQEKRKPTILRAGGNAEAPSSGSFWIDPATGRVLMSVLRNSETDSVLIELTVTYGTDQATGLQVPVKMTELTVDDDEQTRVEGSAEFTHWRVTPRAGR